MATLIIIIDLVWLFIECIIYDYPAVVLSTLCAHLICSYGSEYLRRRRSRRRFERITNGSMDSSVPIKDRLGCMTGAWGFKFFESDHDYIIAGRLSVEMGLCASNPSQCSASPTLLPFPLLLRLENTLFADAPTPDPKMRDSLLNPKDRNFVAQHIQKPTELDRVFKKYLGMLQKYKVIKIEARLNKAIMMDSPRYYIFLLGLLAMQLGCTLSRKHRRWMKANWDSCLFMYERLDQAKMAAFDYQNGTPLKLGSQTRYEKKRNMAANEGLNVPNNAMQVSRMRMYFDNEVAKGKGATGRKGVDISNAFAYDVAHVAALRLVMTESAKYSTEKDSVPKTPTAYADIGFKAVPWAPYLAVWDRLKQQHTAERPRTSVNNASPEEVAELLVDLLKKGYLG
ncbi:hypothetical protein P171DRAFT_449811 [Karstenula rhodostoma CBS 690.94]|uniref:Uncharacterized protein n=1 Tax=Karstenula rhodostoma CBS 690.94 TaxID=1392251 RepID=A0A9P4U5D1_9PLEO|nr:hypothetical protein P171DRAFT_449811 [Karstenula rhodostoma CBS 690.94]